MKIQIKHILTLCFICFVLQLKAQSTYINSIDPKNGYSGQLISVKGVQLSDVDRVFFGSVEGSLISASDQLVEVKAPAGATFDNITLLNSSTDQYYYSGQHFYLSFGGASGITATDFDEQVDITASDGLFDVAIQDLDGDGKSDVIGANSESNLITILRNLSSPGTVSFSKSSLNIGASGLNVTTGDLNGDGKSEVVFTEGNDGDRLLILVNNSTPGNFAFTLQSITIAGSSTKRAIIRDLDLDGKPDLTVSDQAKNSIYIVRNNSSGGSLSFDGNIIELTVANAASTAGLDVEDLNGDNKPEIITNQFLTDGGGFFIASNQSTPGNFSFNTFNQFNSSGTFVNLKVADINNDNKPDILATLFLSSSVAVFTNQSTGSGSEVSFSPAQNLSTNVRPWGLDFGDMDGDGDKDIVVSTIGEDLAVNVLNNSDGSGSNFQRVTLPVTYINRNIKVADIDGDSKPDIVFTSVDDQGDGTKEISVLRNNKCIIPIITPESPVNACSGNPVTLETQHIEGLTYEWQLNGTVVKSGTENFIELTDGSESGDYTVTIISDGGTCAETSETVTVNIVAAGALPSATISEDGPVCTGGTLMLASSDVGATTYEWRGPDNFSASGIQVTVDNFNTSKAGRYFLDVYSGSCIVETKSVTVDVISAPNFSLSTTGSGTYCEGDAVTLTISPDEPGFSYQWFNDSGIIAGETNTTFNPTESGNYFAEVTDNNNASCPAIETNALAVEFLQPPNAAFNLPSEGCTGNSISFTDESDFDNNATVNYFWNFGDGNVSTERNPSHIYNSSGTFDVSLEVSYDGFTTCLSEFSQPITINGELNFSISSSSTAICEGDSSVLSLDNPFNTYNWSTGETTSSIIVRDAGNYSVTVTDANGCEGTSEVSITSSPSPTVEIEASSIVVSPNDTITLNASGLANYIWSPDSALISGSSDEVQMIISNSTTVTVEGTNSSGCFGSASIQIIVEESNIGDVIVPEKFFSPNNDGIADSWEIEDVDNYPQCGVEIYDQTGNKIYEAKPYNNDWQGTSNGQPIPDGVYYYVIRCDGEGLVKSGSITLLR